MRAACRRRAGIIARPCVQTGRLADFHHKGSVSQAKLVVREFNQVHH
jgi:hypothetical protein